VKNYYSVLYAMSSPGFRAGKMIGSVGMTCCISGEIHNCYWSSSAIVSPIVGAGSLFSDGYGRDWRRSGERLRQAALRNVVDLLKWNEPRSGPSLGLPSHDCSRINPNESRDLLQSRLAQVGKDAPGVLHGDFFGRRQLELRAKPEHFRPLGSGLFVAVQPAVGNRQPQMCV
jgi:hypothetical protein